MNYLKWQCAGADFLWLLPLLINIDILLMEANMQIIVKISQKSSLKAHFVVTIFIVLTLASDLTVLHENDAFSILVLSTKKRNSSFLKKIFVFQKIYLKFKLLKTFNIFTDCHIKTCQSPKQRAILKIPSTVF